MKVLRSMAAADRFAAEWRRLAVVLAVAAFGLTTPPAAPATAQSGRCDVTVDKTAAPEKVRVGEPVEITLEVQAVCPPSSGPGSPSDIILVIDRSASMRDNELFGPTIDAARVFLSLTDFSIHQVALATFHMPILSLTSEVEIVQPLTGDGDAVRAALDGIPRPDEFTGATDLASAIDGAQAELAGPRRRPEAQPVMVLLTDGEHNALLAGSPLDAADRAKDAGSLLLTIGLGVEDEGRRALERIASRPELYFDAPSADELRDVYRAIAGQLSAPGELADIEIVDIMTTEVELVEDSARPEPDEATASSLTWRLARLPADGWRATYRVIPRVPGTYSPNKLAYVDYLDADGSVGSTPFPMPMIEVVEDDGLVRAYLPAAWRNWCKPARPFDVVLAMDTSNSMAGEKLERSVAAAREFVSYLDMPPSRAGILGFNDLALTAVDLTEERAAVLQALDGLSTAPGTRIDRALRSALAMLQARPEGPEADRLAVIVLLTDGRQNGADQQEVYNAAASLRRSGLDLMVFAIGIGPNADDGLLRQVVAPNTDRYFAAASSEDLRRIYREIAGRLPCGR